MADIKNAREIAQEKLADIGETTEEERLRWKYIPQGEKLAMKYFNNKLDLVAEIAKYEEEVKKYILAGARKVLIDNLDLPKNETIKSNNEKVLDVLLQIKHEKNKTKEFVDKIRHVFKHYNEHGEQQRQRAYDSLKAQYSSRLQQAVEQQLGSVGGLEINVESLTQFKEEWQRTLAKMEEQYAKLLCEYKHELKEIN